MAMADRDTEVLVFHQTQQMAEAAMAQDDFNLAYRLQLEEALQASCNDLGLPWHQPSPSPSPSPSPNPNPNPSDNPSDNPSEQYRNVDQYRKYCDVSPSDRSLAFAMQNLELSRSQQEAEYHRSMDMERRRLEQEFRMREHDKRFARSLKDIDDMAWEERGDLCEDPFIPGMNDDSVCELYVTSIAMVDSDSVQPFVGAVVMDPDGLVLCEIRKPLELGTGKTLADYMALTAGLEAVLALQLLRVEVYTDSVLMYNQVTGRWKVRSQRTKMLHTEMMQLTYMLEQFHLTLIPRSENGHALKLAREALYSAHRGDRKEVCEAEEAKEDCTICFEGKKLSEIHIIPDCSHRFCLSCIVQHAEVKVQMGQVPVRCPQVDCTQTLSIALCKSILSTKWYELLNKRIIEANMPESERVYCPFPKCSALMSRETISAYSQGTSSSSSLSVTRTACVECFRMFCVECRVPWHASMTCQQYQQLPPDLRDAQDAKLHKLAENQKWQRCTKCRRMIELAEGCFHITCRCGHEFCYVCGAAWKNKKQSCKCQLWDEGYLLNDHLSESEAEDDAEEFISHGALSDYDDDYEDSEDFNELNARFLNDNYQSRINPHYKTQLCRFWERGRIRGDDWGCNRGDDCNFAHGVHELRGNPVLF